MNTKLEVKTDVFLRLFENNKIHIGAHCYSYANNLPKKFIVLFS